MSAASCANAAPDVMATAVRAIRMFLVMVLPPLDCPQCDTNRRRRKSVSEKYSKIGRARRRTEPAEAKVSTCDRFSFRRLAVGVAKPVAVNVGFQRFQTASLPEQGLPTMKLSFVALTL